MMNDMKGLLVEYTPFTYDVSNINESIAKNGGKFIVEGPLQRAGAKNANGRIYPRAILEREAKKYQEVEIAERRALGELDHPESSVVNLRNVSHNILNLEWRGNDIWGTVEVLNTPSGRILQELFKSGVTLGISSRGMGSVRQLDEGALEVQPDFELVCWDFVSNPSTQGAFMKQISEGTAAKPVALQEAHTLIRDIICELSGQCCLK